MQGWKMACGLSGVLAAGLAAGSAGAATLTWDGGGATDALSDPLNWNPDQSPGVADVLIFGLAGTPFATADLRVASIDADRTGLRNAQSGTLKNPTTAHSLETLADVNFLTQNNSNQSLRIDGVSGAGPAATPGLIVGGDLTLDNTNGGTGDAALLLNSILPTDANGGPGPRDALVQVNGRTLINSGGSIEGSGVLRFGSVSSPTGNPALINDGRILARFAGPLPILNPPPPPSTQLWILADDADRPVDLDGTTNLAQVEVDTNATLRVSQPLLDPFGTAIQLGDGSTLWMEHDWTLEGDILVQSGTSAFGSIADVATVRGGQVTLRDNPVPGGFAPTLFVQNGNRLVLEADVNLIDGEVVANGGSIEVAGGFVAGAGTQVQVAGLFEVRGDAVFNDGSALLLDPLGQGVRVADGGRLELRQGFQGGALGGDEGLLEIAAGGTLRFAEDPTGVSNDGSQYLAEITNAGRVEVEGLFGQTTPFGALEAEVGDYTQTHAGALVSIANFNGGSRDFGTLLYQDRAVTLDGTLELRLDAVAAADPTVLDGQSYSVLVGVGSLGDLSSAFLSGTFDAVNIVSDLTGEVVAGITADVAYNQPTGGGAVAAVVTSVTFAIPGGVFGDFDDSGQVEQGDLNLVLNNWGGLRGLWSNTDGLTTTQVDQEELNAVLNNWGAVGAPSFASHSAVVPEPGALAALLSLVPLTQRWRRD
ncbi:MAG: hypothetical protein AAF328_09090 [Planctomycetota bacterium]